MQTAKKEEPLVLHVQEANGYGKSCQICAFCAEQEETKTGVIGHCLRQLDQKKQFLAIYEGEERELPKACGGFSFRIKGVAPAEQRALVLQQDQQQITRLILAKQAHGERMLLLVAVITAILATTPFLGELHGLVKEVHELPTINLKSSGPGLSRTPVQPAHLPHLGGPRSAL